MLRKNFSRSQIKTWSEKRFQLLTLKTEDSTISYTTSFLYKEPCHFIVQQAGPPWQTRTKWKNSSQGRMKHLRTYFRPNKTDLIIFSAFYSKQHVTYFRPRSELTIINCNLYRFNTWTGLLKKKKELKRSWKATKIWNRNDWFDCCEFNLDYFQVSQ